MSSLFLSTLLLEAGQHSWIWKILISAVSFFVAAIVLKGVEIKSFVSALILAVAVAILNMTVGAVLNFLAFPITFITLGLFRFVIDAIIILIADYFLEGFKVNSFGWAVVLAILVSVLSSVILAVF